MCIASLNLFSVIALIRIDLSNPLGVIIIAVILVLAACGLVNYVLSILTDKIILPIMGVPKEARPKHLLNKIVWIITGLVLLAGIVMIWLPIFGLDTGPLNLLNILGR